MFDNEKQAKQLIEKLLKTDKQFKAAYEGNKKKTFDGFMKYFFQCAQDAYIKSIGKTNGYMSSIVEDEVASLIVHYWTEDKPKVGDITLGSAKFMKIEAPKKTAKDKPTPKPKKIDDDDMDFDIEDAEEVVGEPTPKKPTLKVVRPKKAAVGIDDDDDFDID